MQIIISYLFRNPSVAKKDLNFLMNKEKIMLPPEMTNNFLDIIEKDTKFFEENHIIDYSLLMGIHYMTSGKKLRGLTLLK